ncbi:hypothetical protein BY458DRAFT_585624 [Sporodiniella umbellata]|nr:hypothetical protein BY458DRAFT_585624 [Sporodiniella umbellata]
MSYSILSRRSTSEYSVGFLSGQSSPAALREETTDPFQYWRSSLHDMNYSPDYSYTPIAPSSTSGHKRRRRYSLSEIDQPTTKRAKTENNASPALFAPLPLFNEPMNYCSSPIPLLNDDQTILQELERIINTPNTPNTPYSPPSSPLLSPTDIVAQDHTDFILFP